MVARNRPPTPPEAAHPPHPPLLLRVPRPQRRWRRDVPPTWLPSSLRGVIICGCGRGVLWQERRRPGKPASCYHRETRWYNNTNMIGAPYGDHWRNLRRLCTIEIFSTHRLNCLLYVRTDEVRRLISRLFRSAGTGNTVVEMKAMLMAGRLYPMAE
ncbi:PREDICTED: uncharacterized protein LOC104719304 [Camelina sativa]|uniref:Uncharacterized protein LOC104719304 n=1 Tax=Camelina sativa TaxID=90675 RepID=A0ABM0U429_CAMSA|nr:PREDICTED: uncharacterized protein LOC104719304 [Camelina sativa]